MAKDVITRFKLETTQFDSRIKSAAKELTNITKSATAAGQEFSRYTKSSVDAAKALGSIATSSSDAKGKLKELVSSFNDVAKAYNNLNEQQKKSDFGKALSGSLEQLQARIRETKQDMQSLNTGGGGEMGGFLSGNFLKGAGQVFIGNVMTKAAGAVAQLGTEIADCVKEGMELARQGEGIRMAFERLDRPDILDKVREATHGTVTDLELMKQAVKFNDFKLDLNEMGTLLAFAQQKAKDTGQSVDYMVDSIVTGLGRQSLMILDNLGLSASEVKAKMKETGDMTKAVGAIIREQMSKAGAYVETAADRATRADVELKNAMEELGRTFQPLSESGATLWNNLKIGALDLLNNAVRPLIQAFTDLGYKQKLNGEGLGRPSNIDRQINTLKNVSEGKRESLYNLQLQKYNQRLNEADRQLKLARSGGHGSIAVREREYNALKSLRDEYRDRGQAVLHPVKNTTPTYTDTDKKNKNKGAHTTIEKTEMQLNSEKIKKLTEEYITASEERRAAIQAEIKTLQERNKEIQGLMDQAQGKIKPTQKLTAEQTSNIARGGLTGNDYMKAGAVEVLGTVQALNKEMERLKDLRDKATTKEEWERLNEAIKGVETQRSNFTGEGRKPVKAKEDNASLDKITSTMSQMSSGVSSIVGGLEQMGVEIPKGLHDAISAIQGVTTILMGISSLVTIITTIQGVKSVPVIGQFLAGGGVAHAARGMRVPGNYMSGDQVPAMLNSGEVVLNRAQTGNIASQLAEGGQAGYTPSHVSGEQIYIAMNRYLKRSGKGEIVTWRQ